MSKVVLKKEDTKIQTYFQGNKITPKKQDKITIDLMEELYESGFFEQLDAGDLKSFLTLTKTENNTNE